VKVSLAQRLASFVEYEERAMAQTLVDLRVLLRDVENMEKRTLEQEGIVSNLLLRIRELEERR